MSHYALRKAPRTTTRALTDCVVTRADGTSYVIPKTPAPSAETLAAREKIKALNARKRREAAQNARIDAINAIEDRRPTVNGGRYSFETIHEPRGW